MKPFLVALVLCVACGSSTENEPDPVTPVAQVEPAPPPDEPAPERGPILEPDVAALVSALPAFEGWTVVPFAQCSREDKVVAVLWPAIAPNGQVVDDDVIGVTLARTTEGLQVVNENWGLRTRGALERELGGEPTNVRRGEGVPMNELAEALTSTPAAFAQRVAAGDREGALAVAVQFSRIFGFQQTVLEDTVAELLATHTLGSVRIEAESAQRDGDRVHVRVRFFQDDRLAEEEILIATMVEGDEARWVFTDHERTQPGEL